MPAPLFPYRPGGKHPSLPQDVGAVLSEPREPGGAGTDWAVPDVERMGRKRGGQGFFLLLTFSLASADLLELL